MTRSKAKWVSATENTEVTETKKVKRWETKKVGRYPEKKVGTSRVLAFPPTLLSVFLCDLCGLLPFLAFDRAVEKNNDPLKG